MGGRNPMNNLDLLPPEGIPLASWLAIGAEQHGDEWHTPERDATGEIIGTQRRLPTGRKIMVEGSKRGLVYVHPLRDGHGDTPDLPVFVVEGATDTAAAHSLALVAVGRPSATGGGDYLADLLEGRHVAVLGENDDGVGQTAPYTIADRLAERCASVRVVFPPKEHKDLRAWVSAGATADDVVGVLRYVEPVEKPEPEPDLRLPGRFEPFPVDALPNSVRAFVDEGAAAIGCDPSYIVLPMLSALASAIGNTRRIELRRIWVEPPIFWTAIVGESGTAKSPALDLALRPVRKRQHLAMREHREALELHEAAMAEWKAQHGRKGSDSSSPPVPPVCRRTLTDDTTTEAVAHLLSENPRGLLVARDELAGWFGSFGRYAGGKGGDEAKWLEVFGGRALITDRRGSGTNYIPRASVCICGGIQPGALRRSLGTSNIENGLAARLLFAMPPRSPKRWTDDDVSEETERAVERVFEQLYGLEPDYIDGDDEPRLVRLSPEAKLEFAAFVDRHGQAQTEYDGAEAAAWSKLEGYGARLALVVHLTRWAAGEADEADTIDVQDVRAAVKMVEWFAREASRVYALLDGDDADDKRGQLVDLIRRKGGVVTARELVQASRRFPKTIDAERALDDLAGVGAGKWDYQPGGGRGGRPSKRFQLSTRLRQRNPPPERANGGFVDVDTQPDDTRPPDHS